MFKTTKSIIKNIRFNLGTLLLFEIIYKGLLFLAFVPLAQILFRYALSLSKYSFVTKDNMLAFILSPKTLLILIAFFIVLGVFMLYDMSALISCYQYSFYRERISLATMFITGLKGSFGRLRIKNIGVIPYIYLIFIISNIPIVLVVLYSVRMPTYVVGYVYKQLAYKIIVSFAVIAIIIFAVVSLFSMFYFLIDRRKFIESIKESFQMLKRRYIKTVITFIVWNIMFAIAFFLVYVIAILFTTVIIYLFVKRSLALALFLNIYDKINTYMLIIITAFGWIGNIAVLSTLFFEYQDSDGLLEDFVPKKHKLSGIRYRKVIISIILLVIGGSMGYFINIIYNGAYLANKSLSSTIICSHRGCSISAPENTLPAIQEAIDNMADYAEIDVQLTKDGEVVLLHDNSLLRTTGVDKNIWEVTYDELQGYDAGKWFSKDFEETKVPTLEEVLILSKGKINLNIEIKGNAHNSGIEEKVVALIEKYDFERQCVITSMSYNALENVKEINPDIKTGYIMSMAYGNFYNKKYADFFSLKSSFVVDKVVRMAHSYGKEVYVWTVNSESEMERLKSIGVDAIITDNPVLAREILYKKKYNESYVELLKMLFKEE